MENTEESKYVISSVFNKAKSRSKDVRRFASPAYKKPRRNEKIGRSLFIGALSTIVIGVVYQSVMKGLNFGLGSVIGIALANLCSDNHYNKEAAKEFKESMNEFLNDRVENDIKDFAQGIVDVCANAIKSGTPITQEYIAQTKEALGIRQDGTVRGTVLTNLTHMYP